MAVTLKEFSAKKKGRSQSRIKDMIRKGKHFAAQRSHKGAKRRSWWRSPVSKDLAHASQKSTRRASRKEAGVRRKVQSLLSKRKASNSKRHQSRKRGGSLRVSSWRNTKKTRRKNSVKSYRTKNRVRNSKNKGKNFKYF